MTDIAKELARESEMIVLSGAPGSNLIRSKPGQPTVIEVRSWWPGKSALVSRSLAAVLFAFQIFLSVLKHTRSGDAVLCVTTPFTLPYAVALAARLRGASAALIIYDLYPDSLIMAGFLHPASMLTKMMRWANKVMFERLDAIVTIGRDMSSMLMAYPNMTAEKITFIPNWATLAVRYRQIEAGNIFRQRCGGKFLVAMSGNAGFTHDPESVFEAARMLQHNRDIHFLFSGEGVGWIKLKERQAASPLDNVSLVERVPEADLESFLSAADVWVIPYRKNNRGVSVPSRIYNLLAVGRPVIICSEPDAEAAVLIREHDLGWVVQPENPAAIAEVIRVAAQEADRTADKGQRAAEIAPQYTRRTALRSYRELMSRLLDGRSSCKSSN
ncbi:glycosyltransferase family 4 protein [Bradyrhizobium diazoefficiens]|nr:glycosyltransferase family 4 protein [Bradyrhizobium diazoefficiens]MBR0704829.1 glycosyltransferase family 4 protein [Bradyrhizobium diazoefficiens]MBR0773178.1 glycosyltransferase family 4 protein [Bradyrhizobium diazoefficiens]